MTDVITEIEHREGDGAVTNDPADGGGRTQFGISEHSNPAAWADGKVTEEEARAIYETKYISGPGFNRVPAGTLRSQLIDFGVNSGPAVAIKALQTVILVHPDGVLGPDTLHVLEKAEVRGVNNAVGKERVKMIGRIVAKNPSQLKYLVGWLNRACEFIG